MRLVGLPKPFYYFSKHKPRYTFENTIEAIDGLFLYWPWCLFFVVSVWVNGYAHFPPLYTCRPLFAFYPVSPNSRLDSYIGYKIGSIILKR